jgi:hypothetical protein
MAKSKTKEEKLAFITANLSLVPEKSKEDFNKKNDDDKYKKMLEYVRKYGKKDVTAKPKFNVKSVMKHIIDLNPSTKQLENLIEKLTDWKNTSKEREKKELEEQVKKLQEKINKLS